MGEIASVCCSDKKEFKDARLRSRYCKQLTIRKENENDEITADKNKQPSTSKSTFIDSRTKNQNKQLQQTFDQVLCEQEEAIAHRKVVFEDFEIKGKLGSGNFGAVFKVHYVMDIKSGKPVEYAMKRIALNRLNNKRSEQNVKLQRFILSEMQNPFITQLKFAFKDQNYIFLVMECGSGGSLDSLLNIKKTSNAKKNMRAIKFKNLGEYGIKFVAANIILGIQHLHNHNIMYRDLKPQNVIIFEDGYLKLTDFGLSKVIKENDKANSQAGTIVYFAPEIVSKTSYTKSIDFWALGIFLYELLTSETPFKQSQILSRKKFKDLVKENEKSRNWRNETVSQELKDIINKLLVYQPDQRLGTNGFQEIKNHPFFKEINWQLLKRKELESPLKQIIMQHPQKITEVKSSQFKTFNSVRQMSTEQDEWDYNHTISLGQFGQQKQQ